MPISFNDEKLTGLILPSFSNIAPEGFFLCDGTAKSRTAFPNLFAISPSVSGTITVATANVITWTAHGLATGHSIQFSTTGTLPTGLTVGTVYFIRVINANTFNLYGTQAQAMNTAVTTGQVTFTVTGTGVHSALVYYWGNGDGSTTFNIPDCRGVYLRGIGSPQNFLDSTNYTFSMGQKLDDYIQDHKHVDSGHAHGNVPVDGGNYAGGHGWLGAMSGYGTTNTTSASANLGGPTANAGGTPRATSETRVKSIVVNYFIKY